MRSYIFLFVAVLGIASSGGVCYGQVLAPPGAGDKTVGDRGIKDRAIELNRIERESRKKKPGDNQPQLEPMSAEKFAEMKADFENLQRMQADIVAAYTTGQKLDFAKISASAEQMNKSGIRLNSNLFPVLDEVKKKKKKSKDDQKAEEPDASLSQDMKALIVEIDNTIASFVGSPMFTNPQVINIDANAKTRADLESIIKLSAQLKASADKAAN